MKTMKFLSGLFLLILFISTIIGLEYPAVKEIVTMPKAMIDKHWFYYYILLLGPIFGVVLGVVAIRIHDWFEKKCKELK